MTMSDLKLFFCLFDRVFPKGAVFRANSGKTSGSAKYKLNILWYLPLLFFFENVYYQNEMCIFVFGKNGGTGKKFI